MFLNDHIICKATLYCTIKSNSVISLNVNFIDKIKTCFYNTSEFGLDVHDFFNGATIFIIDFIHNSHR